MTMGMHDALTGDSVGWIMDEDGKVSRDPNGKTPVIMEAMREADGTPMRVSDLVAATGIERKRVEKVLSQQVKRGAIRRHGIGLYVVAN